MHREVNVIRLEDNGVGRPPSHEADAREERSNGVGCGGSPFSEVVRCLAEAFVRWRRPVAM